MRSPKLPVFGAFDSARTFGPSFYLYRVVQKMLARLCELITVLGTSSCNLAIVVFSYIDLANIFLENPVHSVVLFARGI